MLHHISVAVNNPLHVAKVLAEILQGSVAPFPFNPGSYVTLAGDEFGTLFEFYPLGSELIPDAHEGQAGFRINPQPTQYSSFHAAISVPISLEEIQQIGDREGWRVLLASRDGLFDVVEFWLENRLMLEFLTPEIAPKYLEAFNPQHLSQFVEQLSLVEARR
uniref:VOC domain-containing protein n=1 Tax=Cyanothece sp. (strain PCC 7425 / ATCC 29141) TaxID=395961 RepID=B8HT30_CYAP4